MNICVFSPAFEVLGYIETADTVRLTKRLYKPGLFELLLHPEVPYAETLAFGNLIMMDRDPRKCGMVEYLEETIGPEGETLTVRGRTLEGLLLGRLAVPPSVTEEHYEGWDRVRGPGETVIKHYVTNHCIAPEFLPRQIPELFVADDQGRGPEVPWQARFTPLDEICEDLYEYTKLGYEIYADIPSKRFIFDVIEGRDCTAEQSENPRIVFDAALGNLSSLRYIEDHMEHRNVGYAGGEGADEDRLIYQVGDTAGFSRREVFLDCGGANIDDLIDTGRAKLAEKDPKISIVAEVLQTPAATYGSDYHLGDTVTVRHRRRSADVLLNAQITEVTEVHEPNQTTWNIVFGTQTPTPATLAKRSKEVL